MHRKRTAETLSGNNGEKEKMILARPRWPKLTQAAGNTIATFCLQRDLFHVGFGCISRHNANCFIYCIYYYVVKLLYIYIIQSLQAKFLA